jgi:hypothetical protein
LVQYAEAFPNDNRVLPAITRSLKRLDIRFDQGLDGWAEFRWQELVYSIQWMFDKTQEPWLLALSKKVYCIERVLIVVRQQN